MLPRTKTWVTAAALTMTCCYAAFYIYKRLKKLKKVPAAEAFKLNINMVSGPEYCERMVFELRRRSMEHSALGFDCEWVTKGSKRHSVALLQLSTYDGFCVLFRLNIFNALPSSLTNLLSDSSIYKVGITPLNDANYLYNDHGIAVASTLDLRYFVEMCGHSVGGLAYLSETQLGVILDKSFKVRCSNWDAETLTPEQIHYAASDAHSAIRIFVKLVNELDQPPKRSAWCLPDCIDSVWEAVDDVCQKYADINYKNTSLQKNEGGGSKKPSKRKEPKLKKAYPLLKRSKPFYDNCLLQAPDGELLTTCERSKALWYINKGLADRIADEPLTVRLRFEPAGRSVGDVGKYYTLQKKNHCVVCGATESYIRKNVVPREYRKYFPDIMKDHSSHDVVLLCGRCHQRSNVRDQVLREHLAAVCRTPLPDKNQPVEDAYCKKVRMAARALFHNNTGKHVLPEKRRQELEAVVLSYYSEHTQVTEELLQQACKLSVVIENENHMESYGLAVVKYYLTQEGGLLALEQLWRTHFLTSMMPQHMPELWSITHTQDRLLVKWNEGRLSKEELQSIGIEGW